MHIRMSASFHAFNFPPLGLFPDFPPVPAGAQDAFRDNRTIVR